MKGLHNAKKHICIRKLLSTNFNIPNRWIDQTLTVRVSITRANSNGDKGHPCLIRLLIFKPSHRQFSISPPGNQMDRCQKKKIPNPRETITCFMAFCSTLSNAFSVPTKCNRVSSGVWDKWITCKKFPFIIFKISIAENLTGQNLHNSRYKFLILMLTT